MKKIFGLVLLTACVSTAENHSPQNLVQIGQNSAKIKTSASVDLDKDDWKQSKSQCVTHLYQCQIDDKGQVTGIKAMDVSDSAFQSITEESLRAFRFEG